MQFFGQLSINLDSCQVYYAGKPVPLKPQSYKLLLFFFQHPHKVLTTEDIVDHLWTEEKIPTDSTVRTHIKLLRQAFKKAGLARSIIKNIHGIGYQLNVPIEDEYAFDKDSAAILEKLRQIHQTEYVEIDKHNKIVFCSLGITKYSDFTGVLHSVEVTAAFPALIGLEKIFADIRNNRRNLYTLKHITLPQQVEQEQKEFMNIYIVSKNHTLDVDPEKQDDKEHLLIFIEEETQSTRERQPPVVQHDSISSNHCSQLSASNEKHS